MDPALSSRVTRYIELQKEVQAFRLKIKNSQKEIQGLENDIKDFMLENNMDEIKLNGANIVLYNKKTPQTFKKEVIKEKIEERLKDEKKAEELAEAILQNKKYAVVEKIKAVLKKA